MLTNLPIYNLTGWYYSNRNGAFKLTMPNYVPGDEGGEEPASVRRGKTSFKPGHGVLRMEEPAAGRSARINHTIVTKNSSVER